MIFACSPLAALGVACGLDETGLLVDASIDVTTGPEGGEDVAPYDVLNDVPLPPSCTNVDLSCLGFGAGLPDGWSPYVASLDAACPKDFDGSSWVTNTRLAAGSCACSCTASGAWTCPSTAAIGVGVTGCGLNTNGVPVAQCQNQDGGHIQLLDAAASSGNVTCSADAAPPIPQSDSVTLCSFGCEAGATAFCASPPGTRCIVTEGIQTCPGTGLTVRYLGASAAPSCATCTCTTSAPPGCPATAYVFHGYDQGGYHPNTTCDDGGGNSQDTMVTVPLDGSCQTVTNGFDSFEVTFGTPPAPQCNPGTGSGDAGLASPKTICCN